VVALQFNFRGAAGCSVSLEKKFEVGNGGRGFLYTLCQRHRLMGFVFGNPCFRGLVVFHTLLHKNGIKKAREFSLMGFFVSYPVCEFLHQASSSPAKKFSASDEAKVSISVSAGLKPSRLSVVTHSVSNLRLTRTGSCLEIKRRPWPVELCTGVNCLIL